MYIRTHTRRNKNGSSVTYYQLAHNVRDPKTKKSVPRIIHNFGRADQLDRSILVRLCKSIARVCNLKMFDPESFHTNGNGQGYELYSYPTRRSVGFKLNLMF